MARTTDERLDYLMEQLEKGTQNIFESGRYAEYLAVMSKFHHYSFRNTILIFLQQEKFGATPEGDRLERIKRSPNYKDGAFTNIQG